MKNLKQSILFCIIILISLGYSRGHFAKIKYITPETVYIDKGETSGIQVGDTLFVQKRGKIIATLKVVYIASNSASCKVLRKSRSLKVGDRVWIPEKKSIEKIPASPAKRAIPSGEKKELKSPPPIAKKPLVSASKRTGYNHYRIRGGVNFQYYSSQSKRSGDFSYTEPSLNFRFKMDNILNRLSLRMRLHSYQVNRRFNNLNIVPQNEWRKRIYEFSLETTEENAPLTFSVGRIISNVISGMGYLDGFLGGVRLNSRLQLGGFAGTEPDWRTSGFRSYAPKYGVYLKYKSLPERHWRWQSAVAMTGSYVRGNISREYLYLNNQFYWGRHWSVYQSAELDLNRGWRKEKTHQTLKLSNLYFYVQYQIPQIGNVALSIDSRQNYWNYEIRTLADSLFDDSMRRGARLSFSLKLPSQFRIYLFGGANKRSIETQYNYFYSFSVFKRSVFLRSNSLSLRFYGFENPLTSGRQWTISWQQFLFRRHYFSVQYGRQTYNFGSSGSRLNSWIRTYGQIQIFPRLYLQGSIAFHQGDDFQGIRYRIETGINF